MPERLERLRQLVKELEQQLQQAEALDADSRKLLEDAAADIQKALRDQDPAQPAPQGLVDRLKTSVQEFEADHPTLAGLLNRMIDVLGQMGI